MRNKKWLVVFLCVASLSAQQLDTLHPGELPLPAPVKKLPPAAAKTAADKYAEAMIMLGDPASPALPVAANEKRPTVAASKKVSPKKGMPSLSTRSALSIPQNARWALDASDLVMDSDPGAIKGQDGRIVFPYGRGVFPIVVCPLQITEIDFEPGEVVDGNNVTVGDKNVEVGLHEAAGFQYLALEPTLPGLDTSVVVGTTKRIYYFRVFAVEREHIARVAFSYPEEEADRARKAAQSQRDAEAAKQAEANKLVRVPPPPLPLTAWHYSITVKGKEGHLFEPSSIGDDGTRTFFQFAEKIRKLGLPTVQITTAVGPTSPNFHWEDLKLVVDAVFDQACLLYGVGSKQQRVCVKKNGVAN